MQASGSNHPLFAKLYYPMFDLAVKHGLAGPFAIDGDDGELFLIMRGEIVIRGAAQSLVFRYNYSSPKVDILCGLYSGIEVFADGRVVIFGNPNPILNEARMIYAAIEGARVIVGPRERSTEKRDANSARRQAEIEGFGRRQALD